jgi:3-oxoacyl-[acyl-carrier-protein] synthase II
VATACASGNDAIGTALRWIERGDADVVVTGSSEASLSDLCLADLERLGVLSRERAHPEAACRPFDRERTGLVPAEGAGVLVLEEEGRARRRGAHVYCEVLGWGSSGDAFHPVVPRPDGSGLRHAIERALADAGVPRERVGYVNAHGTGTPVGDAMEARALQGGLGAHARAAPVSSTKSMLGHSFGGSGGIDAAITALAIERSVIPPTIHLDAPDPACDLHHVARVAREAQIDVALSTAFGFGGTNACLVLGRYTGKRR